MFKATFKDNTILPNVLNIIKGLINDTTLQLYGKGISMNTMDGNHICLCKFNLNKDLFSEFLCEEKMNIGLNINTFSKILNCSSNINNLSLELENEDSDKMQICLKGDYEMLFNINLIYLENISNNIDDSKYNNQINIDSKKFNSIIKDLQIIGEDTIIICENNQLIFKTSSDTGELEIKLNEDDINSIENNESYSDSFSLTYLNSFTKAINLSNSVIIKLYKEHPIIIEFYIDELHTSFVKFYLAPRMK